MNINEYVPLALLLLLLLLLLMVNYFCLFGLLK